MIELTEMLAREEAGLTVDRALEDGPSDVQSFQLFLSHEWHAAYLKIYEQLVIASNPMNLTAYTNRRFVPTDINGSAGSQTPGGADANLTGKQHGASGRPSEGAIKAWQDMVAFLREFIDNNFATNGLHRKCVEGSYWERLLNLAPNLALPNQPSLLYADRNYDFTKIMFLGQERELLLLNILSYALFDLWFGSTAISITCCYVLDLGVLKLRERYGQMMLSRRTLVDERFLIG
jgi:hypothetical protein